MYHGKEIGMNMQDVVVGDLVEYVGPALHLKHLFDLCLVLRFCANDPGQRVTVLSPQGVVRDISPYYLAAHSKEDSKEELTEARL